MFRHMHIISGRTSDFYSYLTQFVAHTSVGSISLHSLVISVLESPSTSHPCQQGRHYQTAPALRFIHKSSYLLLLMSKECEFLSCIIILMPHVWKKY